MGPLVIVGAGGHGRETLDVVEAMNAASPTSASKLVFLGFVADRVDEGLLVNRDAAWLGCTADLESILREHQAGYHLAIGSSAARAALDAAMRDSGLSDAAITLVHPLASCGADVRMDSGVLLAAGARVTTNVSIGRHTHCNVNAVVSHDCSIGEFVTLSPGVLVNGNVTIENGVFLGSGAIVLPGRRIGAEAVVGAGAVVTDDVASGVTVVGVPARST